MLLSVSSANRIPVRVSCLPRGLFPLGGRDSTLNRKGYTIGARDTQTRGIASNLDMTDQRLMLATRTLYMSIAMGGPTFREWQVFQIQWRLD